MHKLKYYMVLLLLLSSTHARSQCHHSEGIYRLPYVDGTQVQVTRNHQTHFVDAANTILECRIDMIDLNGTDSIVAAADGWIRAIVDNFSLQLDCDTTTNNNNYVWIEHPNGEWTKYTHMTNLSTTFNAGLAVNDWVCAGTFLGFEDRVGCASGDHLHFEVARPTDGTNVLQFTFTGGYIDQDVAENLIPVICGIDGNIMEDDAIYTAGPCDYDACDLNQVHSTLQVENDEWSVDIVDDFVEAGVDVDIFDGGNGIFQAGEYINLTPGFTAHAGSSFSARIRDCNDPGWDVTPCIAPRSAAEEELMLPVAMQLYPNPANTTVRILLNNPAAAQDTYILVYSVLGQRMIEIPIAHDQQVVELDVTDFPSGTYQVVCAQQGVVVESLMLAVSH